MTTTQLIRQLFPGTRNVPWDHYYELTDLEMVLSTYAINGAPRAYENENLLKNQSGLIGLGKGFGQASPWVLPIEWVYLWACHQAAVKGNLNEQRAEDWGIVFEPPKSTADLTDYLEWVYALKHQQIQKLDDIKGWLKLWRAEVRLCYVYGQYGKAALEPDTLLGKYNDLLPKDRQRLLGPLHKAWEEVRMDWQEIIKQREIALVDKRSPVKRLHAARDAAAARRKTAK